MSGCTIKVKEIFRQKTLERNIFNQKKLEKFLDDKNTKDDNYDFNGKNLDDVEF